MNLKIKDINSTSKYSVSMRVWHWSNYLVISLLFVTVLLGLTILKTKTNAVIFRNELQKVNVEIKPEHARLLAKSLSRQIWHWHTYLGYVLSAMLLFRMLMEFLGKREKRLIYTIKNIFTIDSDYKSGKSARHNFYVKLIYLIFYFLLLVLVLTGLGMAFDDEIPFLKNSKDIIKDIHYYVMYGILFFIVMHIIGVLRAELTANKGIISDMIHGGDEK